MLCVLVSGRFRIDLPDRTVVLAKQGDYVLFRGMGHSWPAEEASIVMTIRWPSWSGYGKDGCGTHRVTAASTATGGWSVAALLRVGGAGTTVRSA